MIHLYSDSDCVFSHMARIVITYKGMTDVDIIDINMHNKHDLMNLNSYNETPVLVDDIDKNNKKKDLVLITPNIICEYIDERFPHPQLMPITPSEKARLRMLMSHLDKELFVFVRFLDKNLNNKETKIKKELEITRKKIIISLDSLANIFVINKKIEFLFGNSFSLLDAAILPLLWRLEYYQITKKNTWG